MKNKGFLKGHANVLNVVLRLIDLSLVLACGVFSYYFSAAFETFTAAGVHGLPESYIKVILLAIILSGMLFPLFNIYRVWRGYSTLTEINHLTAA